jgi:hypothetical protein
MLRILLLPFITTVLFFSVSAQTETLTNDEIIEMSQAGLGKDLILQKIKSTGNNFDVSVKGLIELKKANVEDEIISLIVEKSKTQSDKIQTIQTTNGTTVESKTLTPADALRSARTISLSKSSLNPKLQNLEKELLKLPNWQKINLSITEDKNNADLSIQIGFVHFSLLTHRYVYRVFDKRSGLIIAAGETTSWGSLPHNMAGSIAKSLNKVLEDGK